MRKITLGNSIAPNNNPEADNCHGDTPHCDVRKADARFIENDWKLSPDGEDYAKRLGADLTEKLKVLRSNHDAELAKGFVAD